jgi:hypothetical protein
VSNPDWAPGWYSTALKKLGPLRYHLNEMIQMAEEYNRWAKIVDAPPLREDKIEAAAKALQEAEEFFTGRKLP